MAKDWTSPIYGFFESIERDRILERTSLQFLPKSWMTMKCLKGGYQFQMDDGEDDENKDSVVLTSWRR